ncbi:MAG: RNA polymerase sigma-70 factor [Arcicella sp.]|jgi:RNA polymerase sigma-70 factor (family 1)|nr:RNA polymerase sigma-70 factor [Arcicella sp.]
MTYKSFSDEQLVEFLKKGNTDAFAEIYQRYWFKMYSVAYHALGNKQEAEEIVQDVFVSLWSRFSELEIRNLSVYLIVAVKHRKTNFIKSQINFRKFQEYQILHEIQQSYFTDDIVDFSDLAKAVEEAMKKLPEKSAEIFRKSRFENQSIKDIAQAFDLSEKAVEYHLTKSVKVLREQLKSYQSTN